MKILKNLRKEDENKNDSATHADLSGEVVTGDIIGDHRRLVVKVYLWIRVILVFTSLILLWLLINDLVQFPGLSVDAYKELWMCWGIFTAWSMVLWGAGIWAFYHNRFSELDLLIWFSLIPDAFAIFFAAAASGGTASPFYRSVYFLIAIHAYHLVPPRRQKSSEAAIKRLILLGGFPSVAATMTIYCLLSTEPLTSLARLIELGLHILTAIAFLFLAWINLKNSSAIESKQLKLKNVESSLDGTRLELQSIQTKQKRLLNALKGIHASAEVDNRDVFYQRLGPVAKSVGEVLEAEYCGLGLCKDNKIEDVAIWMRDDRHQIPSIEARLKEVRFNRLSDSFVGAVLARHRQPLYWDRQLHGNLLDPCNPRRKELGFPINQRAANLYEEILKTKILYHMLVLPFYSQREVSESATDPQAPPKPVGYFQLINRLRSEGQVAESGFNEQDRALTNTLTDHLAIVIENFENRQEEQARQQERNFLSSLSTKSDINQLLQEILEFLNRDFNSRVASLWLPVEDDFGEPPNTYGLVLRAVAVGGSGEKNPTNETLTNKLRESFYFSSKDAVIGKFLREETAPADALYIRDLSTYNECWMKFREEIGTNQLLAIPIQPYPPPPPNDALPLWQRLLAVLCLRPLSLDFELTPEIEEKLFRFARHIAVILEQGRLRLRSEQINRLRQGIEGLPFHDLPAFYNRFVNVVREVMDVHSCSMFTVNKSNKTIILAATTAPSFLRTLTNGAMERLEAKTQLGTSIYAEDAQGITMEAFRRGATVLVYDTYKHNQYPPLNQSLMEDVDGQRPRSVLVAPILAADKKKGRSVGVLRCVNPKRPPYAPPTFIQAEKEFMTLLTGILTKFLENAQWNEDKKDFLRQLAHEMITPLSVAEQHTHFVEKVFRGDRHAKDREESLGYIRDNLEFLNHLIYDIQLQFGNLGSRENYDFSRKVDLRPMIEKLKKLLLERARFQRKIDIRTITTDLPKLYVDPMRLEQVIFNILENAIKYSKEGQHDIILKYELIYRKVKGSTHWGWHALNVQNWGLGVVNGEQELIFDEYVRGSNIDFAPSGTGLGLAVSRRIMNNHEGALVLTRRNWPTIFTIFLPTFLETRAPKK